MEFHIQAPDPEEFAQAMAEERDKMNMHIATMQHDLQRFFKELSEEQLLTLRVILHGAATTPMAGAYYEGVVATMLHMKFDYCGCGESHGSIEQLLAQEESDTPEHPQAEPQVQAEPDDLISSTNPIANPSLDDLLKQMEDHKVEPKPDDTTGVMVCIECSQEYPSLDDRMLRRDCPGCVEKAKWG